MRTFIAWVAAGVLLCLACACYAGSATEWSNRMIANEGGGFSFGARPGQQDGYDGQQAWSFPGESGVYLALYRQNGPLWSGETGFYPYDFESPIPDGESKTWRDIYLWSHNHTPILGDRVDTGWYSPGGDRPPVGYTALLTIDYVPAHLNWTGPDEFWWDLNKTKGALLPVPITDDPYNPDNVTRMHLTVYTYLIPEPSSLAALGLALAGVGMGFVRRRR